MKRRDLLTAMPVLGGAYWLKANGLPVSPTRRSNAELQWQYALGLLAGIVITEIILGTLRAYDIDLAAAVERGVRAFGGRTEKRPGATLALTPSDQAGVALSGTGTAPDGGKMLVRAAGFDVEAPPRPRTTINNYNFFIAGPMIWAATKDLSNVDPRAGLRATCGYPREGRRRSQGSGKGESWQQFENGRATLFTIPSIQTFEQLFDYNSGKRTWEESR